MMTENTLFDLPEPYINKFDEPSQTRAEKQARMSKAIKLNELVRNEAPSTSVEAALKVRPKIGKLEQIVLDLLAQHPEGLTIHQMVEKSGLAYNSISPRPSRLVKKGLIYVAGEGRSPTGNRCQIYKTK